jgi:hypothetical protein
VIGEFVANPGRDPWLNAPILNNEMRSFD